MTQVTLFNPNTTPVVFDKDGRIVEGGGRREVGKVDEVGREAIEHGLLIEEKPEGKEDTAEDSKPSAAKASGASTGRKPS